MEPATPREVNAAGADATLDAFVELGPVLITGANGHLGRRLIARLLADPSARVRAVVRSERAAAMLTTLAGAERIDVRIVSYLDQPGVSEAAEGCTQAVHLVGILKETRSARYGDAHEGATGTLREALEAGGARRVVYLSILGASEDAPNPCLASKARAEQLLLSGLVPATVLRVPMVLGPGEIAAGALRAQASAPFVLAVRGGASLEQPIDAEDVVSAIVAALADDSSKHHEYDLAGPESLPRRTLLKRAAALLGKKLTVLPIPLSAARGVAGLLARALAEPPLTPAMLDVLEHDDAIDPGPACRALGITLTPLEETLRRIVLDA